MSTCKFTVVLASVLALVAVPVSADLVIMSPEPGPADGLSLVVDHPPIITYGPIGVLDRPPITTYGPTGQGSGGGNRGAFDINIIPGPTLAGNPAALAAFDRAAGQWEARIADPITVNINAELMDMGDPNVIASTDPVRLFGNYDPIRDAMVADAGDESDDGIVASLPTAAEVSFIVPMPPVTGIAGLRGAKSNFKALGFPDLDQQHGASDATMTFNTQFDFDFDNSDGVDPGSMDFETAAAHELGHALGFESEVDYIAWLVENGYEGDIRPKPLDLFRFENDQAGRDPETPGEFTTSPRSMALGGDPITDTLDTVWGTLDFVGDPGEFRMSNVVDGQQASHWKDDALSGSYIGLMDPTLSLGAIYVVDEPDFRALDLMGYEIIPAGPNEWNLTGGGSYNDFANWTNQTVPDGVGAVPNFVGSITEASTVTVDSPVTVGTINFDNANSYTIAGPATVTLETSGGDAEINVVEGDHTISAPLSSAADLTVDTAEGTDLTIDTQTGYSVLQGALTKDGSGSLALDGNLIVTGDLNHNAGVVEVGPDVLALEGGEVNLADGTTLKASGVINRRVLNTGDPRTSTLEAVGTMDVGELASPDGYDYAGKLAVGENMVGLRDFDFAKLYGGATLAGGALSSYNGIEVQQGNLFLPETQVRGHGTIKDAVHLDDAVIWGEGPGVVLPGIVTGSGTLFNCSITGLSRVGDSPGVMKMGDQVFVPESVIDFAIQGPDPFVLDEALEVVVAGDYDQLIAFAPVEFAGGNRPGADRLLVPRR